MLMILRVIGGDDDNDNARNDSSVESDDRIVQAGEYELDGDTGMRIGESDGVENR